MKKLILLGVLVVGAWLMLRPPRLRPDVYDDLNDAILDLVRPRLTRDQADWVAHFLMTFRKDTE